ncbi:MAG: M50 family metallopeptidase [Oscillatoria princeps RMCB-10]|jgi:putative peptide zinc metalloprotease protein|nr:M50 family metallopeptidase [Oscillatoria princeps RMCB-10]
MHRQSLPPETDYHDWICPDIRTYWKLGKVRDSDQIILRSTQGNAQFQFTGAEGFALQHFTGTLTAGEIESRCQQHFRQTLSPNFILELLQKLVELGILQLHTETAPAATPNRKTSPKLKPCVQWIQHPDNYWILRNPEDVTFLQVSAKDKDIISQLGELPLEAIAGEFCITHDELRYLLQLLTATGMLEGTQPAKPPKKKFTPLSLLSFRVRLFNPDPFLTRHINKLRWIWTPTFGCALCFFLALTGVFGFSQKHQILYHGQQLFASQGTALILPFALLSMLVVSLHELGHAFTLKHYAGIVPEVGFLFMFLIPAAYTNTTDSYCLSRFKRVQVVAAGILVQITLAATGFWLWDSSAEGSWLHTGSYLLMTAGLVTVAINLNPLAKFDGYYLAAAITGINNLRSRAFGFYANLLTGKPIQETGRDCWILAAYAPFSLVYIYFVFGFLLFRVTDWCLSNFRIGTLLLLALWAIYFYFPANPSNSTSKSGGAN